MLQQSGQCRAGRYVLTAHAAYTMHHAPCSVQRAMVEQSDDVPPPLGAAPSSCPLPTRPRKAWCRSKGWHLHRYGMVWHRGAIGSINSRDRDTATAAAATVRSCPHLSCSCTGCGARALHMSLRELGLVGHEYSCVKQVKHSADTPASCATCKPECHARKPVGNAKKRTGAAFSQSSALQ